MVTSRATDDNLIGDQDARTSDIMAPPRQPSRKSAPAKSDPARSDRPSRLPPRTKTPHPTVRQAAAFRRTARRRAAKRKRLPAALRPTVLRLPPPRTPRARTGHAQPRTTRPSTACPRCPRTPSQLRARPSRRRPTRIRPRRPGRPGPSADDSPVLSFGPPSAGVQPAVEDQTIAYPTESAVKSASDDTAASGAPSPFASPTSAGSRPAQAEPPSVSPAAFAWEMPDPPPHSPSSPARTFLRSGTSARNSLGAEDRVVVWRRRQGNGGQEGSGRRRAARRRRHPARS